MVIRRAAMAVLSALFPYREPPLLARVLMVHMENATATDGARR